VVLYWPKKPWTSGIWGNILVIYHILEQVMFARLNPGIMGSNPVRGMEVCCVYSVFVLSCVLPIVYKCKQDVFSGKSGAGTHKRGKDKHTESFVTISLYNITVYFITS
jgi:hypothetical protein